MNKNAIYFPGLNGIRAIASLGVVISHTTLSLNQFGLNPFIFGTYEGNPQGWMLAGFGVSMFFSLSGFLITYLLLQEKKKQKINVKKFYVRRALRIWPLYYLFMIVCLLLYKIFDLEYNSSSLIYYWLFAANVPFVLGNAIPILAHYWSIGVEEQFYIFWPWIIKLSVNNLLISSLTMIFFLIGLKAFLHILFPGTLLETFIHVSRFHCMIIGGVAALIYDMDFEPILKIIKSRFIQILSWIVVFLIILNQFHVASFIDNEIISLITVFIIIGQITKRGIINLEKSILDFLGKISYGVYIIHPLVIFLFAKLFGLLPNDFSINYISVYLLIIITTIGLANLSYEYIEKPFLRIKNRKFSVVPSSGTR